MADTERQNEQVFMGEVSVSSFGWRLNLRTNKKPLHSYEGRYIYIRILLNITCYFDGLP